MDNGDKYETSRGNLLVSALMTLALLAMAMACVLSAACPDKSYADEVSDQDFVLTAADYYLASDLFDTYANYSFEAPYKEYYHAKDSDPLFVAGLAAWQTMNFTLKVGEMVTGVLEGDLLSEKGYYEAALFDILYQGEHNEKLFGRLNSSVKKCSVKLYTDLYAQTSKALDGYADIMADPSKKLTDDQKAAVGAALFAEAPDDYSILGSSWNGVKKILSVSASLEDLQQRVSTLMAMQELSDSTVDVLVQMKANASNEHLVEAIDEIIDIYRSGYSEEELFAGELWSSSLQTVFHRANEKVWKNIVSELGGGWLKLGYSVGMAVSNAWVSTDRYYESFYQMKALSDIEYSLRSTVKGYRLAYQNNRNALNARFFNASVELAENVYCLGLKYSSDYLSMLDETGLNAVLTHYGAGFTHDDLINQIAGDKVRLINRADAAKYLLACVSMQQDAGLEQLKGEYRYCNSQDSFDALCDVYQEIRAIWPDVLKESSMYYQDVSIEGERYLPGGATFWGLLPIDGKLTVDGDLLLDGGDNYGKTSKLQMTQGSLLRVQGNLSMKHGTPSAYDGDATFSEGIVEIVGNLDYQAKYHGNPNYVFTSGFCAAGNAKFVFCGSGRQVITGDADLGNVVFRNGDIDTPAEVRDEYFSVPNHDELFSGPWVDDVLSFTLVEDAEITNPAVFCACRIDLNGHDFECAGDLVCESVYVNKGCLSTPGDVWAENIDMCDGKLLSRGLVSGMSWNDYFLKSSGDSLIRSRLFSAGEFLSVLRLEVLDGRLSVESQESELGPVVVGKDAAIYFSGNFAAAGCIELGEGSECSAAGSLSVGGGMSTSAGSVLSSWGDLRLIKDISGKNIPKEGVTKAYGDIHCHSESGVSRTYICGDKLQTIYGKANLGNVQFQNQNVAFAEDSNCSLTLVEDTDITNPGAVRISQLSLSGHSLKASGELKAGAIKADGGKSSVEAPSISVGTASCSKGGELTLTPTNDNRVSVGYANLNSGSLTINGDLEAGKSKTECAVNMLQSTMKVNGDFAFNGVGGGSGVRMSQSTMGVSGDALLKARPELSESSVLTVLGNAEIGSIKSGSFSADSTISVRGNLKLQGGSISKGTIEAFGDVTCWIDPQFWGCGKLVLCGEGMQTVSGYGDLGNILNAHKTVSEVQFVDGCSSGNLVYDSDYRREYRYIAFTLINYASQAYPSSPTITLSYDGEELEEGKDYSVLSCTPKGRAGEGEAKILGLGDYRYIGTKTYSIQSFDIENAQITADDLVVYLGMSVEPEVVVKTPDGIVLQEGLDYTVSYEGNDRIGTAKATVMGRWNCSGRATFEFEVEPSEAARVAIDAIARIPVEPHIGDETLVRAARSAYDAVPESERSGFDASRLFEVEETFLKRQAAAEELGSSIKTLPKAEELSLEDESLISEVVDSYMQLDEEQRIYLGEADAVALADATSRIADMKLEALAETSRASANAGKKLDDAIAAMRVSEDNAKNLTLERAKQAESDAKLAVSLAEQAEKVTQDAMDAAEGARAAAVTAVLIAKERLRVVEAKSGSDSEEWLAAKAASDDAELVLSDWEATMEELDSASAQIAKYKEEADAALKTASERVAEIQGNADKPSDDDRSGAHHDIDISNAEVVLSKSSFTYNGKVQKPLVETIGGQRLEEGVDYAVAYSDGASKNAGSYRVTVVGRGGYAGEVSAGYKIAQAKNTVKAAKASVKKTLKAKALKKKAATVSLPKVTAKFGKAKWAVSAKDKKKVLSLKSGKIKVKKGAKKGTYTIKLKASVAKTSNYKAASTKAVTVKVTVK